MPNPTKVIVDCSTGEQQIVELTQDEISELEAAAQAAEEARVKADTEAAEKAAAREAIAAKVGLSPADLALLLGL